MSDLQKFKDCGPVVTLMIWCYS